jgi:G protein-coupled receptor GPR1
MIAIHSALYIFKPNSSSGEGGLYPYRRLAYALWAVLPILLAGLAFINNDTYVSEGTYCYLPVRPFWYRLALTWIPRYLIFIIILGIYASIYYYVRYKFHGFDKAGKTQPKSNDESGNPGNRPSRRPKRHSLPPTPPLACHGLIPEASVTDTDGGKRSVSTLDSYGNASPDIEAGGHRFMWASFVSRTRPPHTPTPPSELSTVDVDSFMGPSTPQPLPLHSTTLLMSPPPTFSVESSVPSRSRATSWRDGFVRRFSPTFAGSPTEQRSIVDISTVLCRHPDDTDTSTPIAELELVNYDGQNFADVEMLRTRDKIRRQLRFLFIYPLVYIGMWVVPFVSHVIQYDDRFAVDPPFALSCLTTIFVCTQAAVDCWLFSTREKPWRHIPGTDGGFWASLKFWTGWKGISKRKVLHGPGKTRDEMVREARAAYRRRDEELAQRKNDVESSAVHGEDTRRGERSWWDTGVGGSRDLGGMSPVSEEVSNPMENVVVPTDTSSTPDSDGTLKNVETARLKEANPPAEQDGEGPAEPRSQKVHD